MKKKGLIISTIVMVVVLIASLTTATYAWFSTSSVTSIEGFNVSVASTNDVNIGFRTGASGFMTGSMSSSGFVSGATIYGNGTAGQVGGYWTGDVDGLSNELTHDIEFGAQTVAIGIQHSATAISTPAATKATYTGTTVGGVLKEVEDGTEGYENYSINVAKLDDAGTELDEDSVAKAVANKAGAGGVNGDYVYMLLGVQPTKTLDINTLVVMLDMSTEAGNASNTVGICASIHVAYRICANGGEPGDWTDVDIMGANNYATQFTGGSALATNVVNGSSGQAAYADAYKATYSAASVPGRSYAAFITGLTTNAANIDQIELIIYISGPDTDCINAGKGASCAIKLFFCTTTVV